MPRKIRLDEGEFRALWLAGVPLRDISSRLNIGADTLGSVRRRLGLPPRTAATRPRPRAATIDDPTPEQIATRAAEVRARWDEETREKRLVCRPREDCGPVLPESVFAVDEERSE